MRSSRNWNIGSTSRDRCAVFRVNVPSAIRRRYKSLRPSAGRVCIVFPQYLIREPRDDVLRSSFESTSFADHPSSSNGTKVRRNLWMSSENATRAWTMAGLSVEALECS